MFNRIPRSVVLPAEHGAWSLWLEPVLLALIVAPSAAGILIAILSLASLLIRQPLKIMLVDLRKRKIYLRTRQAAVFASVYGASAAIAIFAVLWRGEPYALIPLIPTWFVAAVVVVHYDLAGNSRAVTSEVLAAAVMAAFGFSICLASDWEWKRAAALGVIILARSAPAVIYVRARLRQIRSGDNDYLSAIALHVIALFAVLALAWQGLTPILSAMAALLLLSRAIYFLRWGALVEPKIVGIQEVTIGLIYVALVAAGYLLSM